MGGSESGFVGKLSGIYEDQPSTRGYAAKRLQGGCYHEKCTHGHGLMGQVESRNSNLLSSRIRSFAMDCRLKRGPKGVVLYT